MTSEETEKEIRKLNAMRSEAQKWRWGASAIVTIAVVACVTTLGHSVRGLFVAGPVQDKFSSTLAAGLKQNVLPEVQRIATQAFTEGKPIMDASFVKLNTRVPELTSATMSEFNLLKKNIPESGYKVLTNTYGAMLKRREGKIHTMFPEVADANISALVENMTAEGDKQIVGANDNLFSKHMTAMAQIDADLTKIRKSEKISPNQDNVNWEMALLVVDGFHQGMHDVKPVDDAVVAKLVQGEKK